MTSQNRRDIIGALITLRNRLNETTEYDVYIHMMMKQALDIISTADGLQDKLNMLKRHMKEEGMAILM